MSEVFGLGSVTFLEAGPDLHKPLSTLTILDSPLRIFEKIIPGRSEISLLFIIFIFSFLLFLNEAQSRVHDFL